MSSNSLLIDCTLPDGKKKKYYGHYHHCPNDHRSRDSRSLILVHSRLLFPECTSNDPDSIRKSREYLFSYVKKRILEIENDAQKRNLAKKITQKLQGGISELIYAGDDYVNEVIINLQANASKPDECLNLIEKQFAISICSEAAIDPTELFLYITSGHVFLLTDRANFAVE